ncbi:hypothetical protein EVAR_73933_1 [Eumeta japonica]|uniref:Uncharacterized protein n=1 Tax=Eumeta variegata TaxID=151549 RepID=A0A4C1T511_EUMVA|nr:hypothetical protein EVAR_73933_1 [Eumeta japonica]
MEIFLGYEFYTCHGILQEHELKEHDFTDSELELDVTENQNVQCSPVTTTLISPSTYLTVTTPGSSNTTANVSCSSNILPFQPIILSKQWQPVAKDAAQICNVPTTNCYSEINPQHTLDIVELPTNCDSSKDCTKSLNASLTYETVTKKEPDLDMEQGNACPLIDQQACVPAKILKMLENFKRPVFPLQVKNNLVLP